MDKEDIIHIDVPTFIRLLELAREDIKTDPPIHFIADTVTKLSLKGVVTMDDYDTIVSHMKSEKEDKFKNEMDTIRKLGGF